MTLQASWQSLHQSFRVLVTTLSESESVFCQWGSDFPAATAAAALHWKLELEHDHASESDSVSIVTARLALTVYQ